MPPSTGQPAPAFTLPSSQGGNLSLADLRGTIVVLYFYPKDNTPGCTVQAQDFRDALPELRGLGATVIGVSKDSLASHGKFRDKFQLTFPLLTDADGTVLEAYGAWGEKSMYGKKMMGLIRSTVIIDKDGTVVRHWPKVSANGHAEQVIAAVRALSGASTPSELAAAAMAAARGERTSAPPAKLAPARPAPARPAPAKAAPAKATGKKPVARPAPAKRAPAKPAPAKATGKKPVARPAPSKADARKTAATKAAGKPAAPRKSPAKIAATKPAGAGKKSAPGKRR